MLSSCYIRTKYKRTDCETSTCALVATFHCAHTKHVLMLKARSSRSTCSQSLVEFTLLEAPCSLGNFSDTLVLPEV
jgi:hypothetical protein